MVGRAQVSIIRRRSKGESFACHQHQKLSGGKATKAFRTYTCFPFLCIINVKKHCNEKERKTYINVKKNGQGSKAAAAICLVNWSYT